MKTHRSTRELAVWGALAFAGGTFASWGSGRPAEVQGPILLLMLVAFALTLPGRAPASLVAMLSTLAFPIVHLYQVHELDPRYLILIIPASIAAFGGRLAGRLLDTAASQVGDEQAATRASWPTKPLSKRFVLAVALATIAVAGLPSVTTSLRSLAHPAAAWLSMVWQVMTLLGWIGLTPLILGGRTTPDATEQVQGGLTPGGALKHVVVVTVLVTIHAVVIVTISAALFIPMVPSWRALVFAAFVTYLPIDLLAYVAILGLGYVSDTERHRRESAQREAALRAESLDNRLAALRARLNPHFLFNVLNSADVLARSGKTAQMSKVLDGLTGLLRYVLDERRPNVTLREELDFAGRYLEVQQIRLGDRLRCSVVTQPGVDGAAVPQLLLQPIIENAVEHGIAQALDGGVVHVEARRDGDVLEIAVDDDGAGIVIEGSGAGIGLSSTRERLARLFGSRASLRVEPRSAVRGTRAVIRIPYETLEST
jgi:signal transduction histidine kinase